ncbi:PqqD family peptide modification chaperone [Terrilactibacillus sp. BCM23-1]|uniref:PqqD family peptide modification chaperone n=2 Tax=Terrilactibacillus tamarindi TaxID=2599694 RepID=A0A6N8CMR9_9BACI|nr:PqqD family peptide modification chaperone [Terrilactibacillus tamarindi]
MITSFLCLEGSFLIYEEVLTMKKKDNMLFLSPMLREGIQVVDGQDAFLLIPRQNWLERLSIRFFKQPAFRKVKLDALGEFVVGQIDGKQTVLDIEKRFVEKFGNDDDMALARLVKFLQILEANQWIKWNK